MIPFPLAAGSLAAGVVALGVLGVVALGVVAFGAAFCSGAVPGVACPDASGVAGEVPGVCGVVLGVCGAVAGADDWEPAVCPLACGVDPDGDVLLGWVWAATQIADNSNMENSIAFDLMAVCCLR